MGVYDRTIKTAQKLIAQKGESVTWRAVFDGAPEDPLQPWLPTKRKIVDTPVQIVFLPAATMGSAFNMLKYMKGGEVHASGLIGLMGAVDFTPDVKDVVMRGNQELRIESLDILSPNGQVILYTVEFKS